MKNLNIIFACFILFALSSCSYLPDWIGTDDTEILEGTRVSLLKIGSTTRADAELANLPVLLPKPQENHKWYRSNSYHSLTSPHPRLNSNTDSRSSTDIGKGGTKHRYLSTSPVIGDGKIFTLDANMELRSYDLKSMNKPEWKISLPVPKKKSDFTNTGLFYIAERLFISTGYNMIISINAKDGSELWRRSINSITQSAPTVFGGRVFVNTIDNKLYALNATDGTILWSHSGISEEVSITGAASPTAKDERVVVAYSSGELYTLRAHDGSEIWSDSLAVGSSNTSFNLSDIDTTPLIKGDIIYASSSNGLFAATEINSGARIWEQDIASIQTPWIAGEFLFTLSENQEVAAIFMRNGGIKWATQLPQFENEKKRKNPIFWSGPILAGNRIIVAGSHGKLAALSPNNGKILSYHKIPKGVYIPPIAAYDKIYLLDNGADLHAMTFNWGNNKSTAQTNTTPATKPNRSWMDKVKGVF